MEALHPSEAKSDEGLHICIHPQCGACGQLFYLHDPIIARKRYEILSAQEVV